MGGKLECGVVNVGPRLTDDLEELGHEAEAISGRVVQGIDIDRNLNDESDG